MEYPKEEQKTSVKLWVEVWFGKFGDGENQGEQLA